MKICHIITTLGYGGAERLLVNLANLHVGRHQVEIIYLKHEPSLQPALDPRVRVYKAGLGRGSLPMVRNLLRRLSPDVIHTHLGHADFIGLIASQGLTARRLCTMHNTHFKWNWRDQIFFLGYRLLFNLLARDVRVIAISQSVARHVRSTLGVPAARVSVVYNGIPQTRLTANRDDLRRELGLPAEAFCVLFVGRLAVQKSVDTLLYAAVDLREQIPNLQVLILGEGPERERLLALTAELGLGQIVRFCGTTQEPERYMGAADLFVLPSVFEGFGLVVIEAFRAGLPVIASAVEGPAELIEHGRNGLLFPPRDARQLAEQIVRLYGDEVLLRRLGAAGQESFQHTFTIEHYAEELEHLYKGGSRVFATSPSSRH